MRIAIGLVLLALACAMAGCSQLPTAPSSPVETTTVLVTAMLYTQQTTPVVGADVAVNGARAGQTDAAGALSVVVPLHVETLIEVRASGFAVAGAAGIVNGPGEHWTFWLR